MRREECGHAGQQEFVVLISLKEEIAKSAQSQPSHQQDRAAKQICPQREQGGRAGFHNQFEQAVRTPAECDAVQDAESDRCEQDAG